MERQASSPKQVVGEANYEGILHSTQAEVQRLTFWALVISDAGGYTYGANGIWQVNTWEQLFGPSPHGAIWATPVARGDATVRWNAAWAGAAAPGALAWERFEPHQEWKQLAGSPEDVKAPFAAGIPGRVRVACHLPLPPDLPLVLETYGGGGARGWRALSCLLPGPAHRRGSRPWPGQTRCAWSLIGPSQPTVQEPYHVLRRADPYWCFPAIGL